MSENHTSVLQHDSTTDQEDHFKKYEELLTKLSTPENVAHKEDGRKFILDHQWCKSEGEPLGSGGQAKVYMMIGSIQIDSVVSTFGGIIKRKEIKLEPKEKCAMKVMKNLKPEQFERRKKECEIIMLINHPNVTRYYDFATDRAKKSVLIYMELMQQSVEDSIRKNGIFSVTDSIRIGIDVLNGLNFVHGLGIIHRDIKSSNILLNENGIAKLADFDVCHVNRSVDLTETGTATAGTVHFMAPEAIRGKCSSKSDIWSVGCLMIHMLSGKFPNHDLKASAVIFSIGSKKIPQYKLPDGLTHGIAEFISRLLSVDTKERPTAGEAIQKLNNFLSTSKQLQTNSNHSFEKTIKLLNELNTKPKEIYGDSIVYEKIMKTLLHLVVENGNEEVLKELLQQKCDLNAGADMHELHRDARPIHIAAYYGNVECLKLLIEAGAELNAKENTNGWTALHWAARNGKIDCIKALIEAGANQNLKNEGGKTALDIAREKNREDCIEYLSALKS